MLPSAASTPVTSARRTAAGTGLASPAPGTIRRGPPPAREDLAWMRAAARRMVLHARVPSMPRLPSMR
jgi:hypothetical protein